MEQQLGVDAVVVEDAIASGAVDVQLVCKPDHAAALDSQLFENAIIIRLKLTELVILYLMPILSVVLEMYL